MRSDTGATNGEGRKDPTTRSRNSQWEKEGLRLEFDVCRRRDFDERKEGRKKRSHHYPREIGLIEWKKGGGNFRGDFFTRSITRRVRSQEFVLTQWRFVFCPPIRLGRDKRTSSEGLLTSGHDI